MNAWKQLIIAMSKFISKLEEENNMKKKPVENRLEVIHHDEGAVTIKITKRGTGYSYGKEIDYVCLTAEEKLKLKDLL